MWIYVRPYYTIDVYSHLMNEANFVQSLMTDSSTIEITDY
jgi:hypothetical protein